MLTFILIIVSFFFFYNSMHNEVWGFSDILPIVGQLLHRNCKTFQDHDEPASVNYTDTMKLIFF